MFGQDFFLIISSVPVYELVRILIIFGKINGMGPEITNDAIYMYTLLIRYKF